MNQGDIIKFGKFEWIILDIKDNQVLLLTNDVVERRPYHHKAGEITWADSDIRRYLNTEFYNLFTAEERKRILKTHNINKPNHWYMTSSGKDTDDYIFLLDIEDVVIKYFGDSSHVLFNKKPNDRYWFNKRDKNNLNRLALYQGYGYWWWLRTSGSTQKRAVYVHGNPEGVLGINGNSVYSKVYEKTGQGGVRPALWISI